MTISLPHRFRRLRHHQRLRELVKEQHIHRDDLILPLFIEEGLASPIEIPTMPGVLRYGEKQLPAAIKEAASRDIKAVILFGVSHHKDAIGSDTWRNDGLVARMIQIAKDAVPEMLVISDNCFCEYTDHGHCGVVENNDVENDLTLVNLQKQAIACAEAGVDMLAPSAMMDGQIAAMREALDSAGFSHLPIMSYSTKFASAFYGPFRDAVDSQFKGTRDTYQMDIANGREALAESLQDEMEGADILMVKPAMVFLDVVAAIRQQSERPLAVYQVSGEYSMIKAAANAGIMDERALVLETLLSFKRAGANLILTYFAKEIADWIS